MAGEAPSREPEHEPTAQDLQSTIERSVEARAAYTRRHFERIGQSLHDFVKEVAGDPYKILIDPQDDRSLTLGVFALQQKLGMSLNLGKYGCDGKLGPYTQKIFDKEKLTAADREKLGVVRAANPPPPEREAPAAARENTGLPETSIEKTWVIGDSLSVGWSNLFSKAHISPDEIRRAPAGWIKQIGSAVGGSLVGPMLARMRAEVAAKKARGTEKVFIFAGVNNIGSGITAEKTIAQLAEMYRIARDAGMKVVAGTMTSWDTAGYVKKKPDFCGKRGMTVEVLTERTLKVNEWIRQQHASGAIDGLVDLYKEMGSFDTQEKGLKRSDQIHFKDYHAMARAIARGARIGGRGSVS